MKLKGICNTSTQLYMKLHAVLRVFLGNFRIFHRSLRDDCIFPYHNILILVLYKAQFQGIPYQILKDLKPKKLKPNNNSVVHKF